MPTSGLVITLSEGTAHLTPVLQVIERLPHVAIGEPTDRRFIPAVIQADQQTTARRIQTIEALPEVHHVSITWIGLDAPHRDPHTPAEHQETAS